MNRYVQDSYNILKRILIDKEYLSMALKSVADLSPIVTKTVYGVLDNSVKYDYYLSELVKTKPNNKIAVILKIGMYLIDGIDSIPDYAAINESVGLAEIIGKKQLKGFVNATLKSYIDKKPVPPDNKFEKMSVEYSKPLWLVKRLYKQYGEEKAIELMSAAPETREHMRANAKKLSHAELGTILKNRNAEYEESLDGFGYYVKNAANVRDLIDMGMATYQSLSSMLAVRALGVTDYSKALDLCAAPGGKSVYLSELAPHSEIIACDIHEHRLSLIDSYIRRMGAEGITPLSNDAVKLKEEWINSFDCVLCDVPCSGLGVVGKKPDILINKTLSDVEALADVQYSILNNAVEYLKPGGCVVYSTCTVLREENYNIIGKMLKLRNDVALDVMDIPFENSGFIQLLPGGRTDGFFIAKLKKAR